MLRSQYGIEQRGIVTFTIFATVQHIAGMPVHTIVGVGLPEQPMEKSGDLFVPFEGQRKVSTSTHSGPGKLEFWKCTASYNRASGKYLITNVWMGHNEQNPTPGILPHTIGYVQDVANDVLETQFGYRIRPNIELVEKHRQYHSQPANQNQTSLRGLQAGAVLYHIQNGVDQEKAFNLVMKAKPAHKSKPKPKHKSKPKPYKSPRKGYKGKTPSRNRRHRHHKPINQPFAGLNKKEVVNSEYAGSRS